MLWIILPLLIFVALGIWVRYAAEKAREEDRKK